MKITTFLITLLGVARLAANPADWMPQETDGTQLWWEEGAPKVMGSDRVPAGQTLCLQFGEMRLRFDTLRMRPVEGAWECVLVSEGQRFACTGRAIPEEEFFQTVRFVESGRFFQRVMIDDLKFTNEAGQEFAGKTRLEITVWPDRLAFRLECDGPAALRLGHGGKSVGGIKSVLLESISTEAGAGVESELLVTRDEELGCHRLALPEKPWNNAAGTYYPEEQLDRMDQWRVTVRNDTGAPTVARLMFTQAQHLPITGFTPMLCDADGTPTGLPVQVSKNWHRRPEKGTLPHEGTWFHGFTWVRVPPKTKRDFLFRMVYARYGGVCAASHAQLCLIGWGHNQFWDEAAVGSFGESICFEPGRVQRRCFITDVRPLMTLAREPGAKRWSWAGNCGGGDFLVWMDPAGSYVPMITTRTEYRSHGPCLTDVTYREQSVGEEIAARVDVSVPAANDYLRTFFRLRYEVKQPVRWQRLAFFQLGADFYNDSPVRRIAIGDITGLRDEWEPRRAKGGDDRTATPLTGGVPWISVHGLDFAGLTKGRAAASRGLIVRSWRAVLGGKDAAPHVATFSTEWGQGNHRTSVELAPPPGLTELQPGDFIEAELEMVVFPAEAAAYYGPDATFRDTLATTADTWRPVHREAAGNFLKPRASHGTLMKNYPLVVAVDHRQRAEVEISGGLGHLPVTITGLNKPNGHRLLVNGQPLTHWQTDWSATTKTWQLTANLPATAPLVKVTLERLP